MYIIYCKKFIIKKEPIDSMYKYNMFEKYEC